MVNFLCNHYVHWFAVLKETEKVTHTHKVSNCKRFVPTRIEKFEAMAAGVDNGSQSDKNIWLRTSSELEYIILW